VKTTEKKEQNTEITPEETIEQLQKIFKEKGSKALEMARKEIRQEKIESKEARKALTYFMTEYWQDRARPTLLSLVCEAVGGDPELTTPIAVSMILISGALDMHDDIIDRSETKDGRSTVFGKFGKDIALLVGDALLFKGLALLSQAEEDGVPAEKIQSIIDIVQRMFFELGDAEALELQLRGRLDISPRKYLQIVRKKAADVEAHTRIGAIIGNASPIEIEAFGAYGRLLGMLIILRDDWIDILDFREFHQRVKNECLPLPILYGMHNQLVKNKLGSLLQSEIITEKKAKRILEMTLEEGVIENYRKVMRVLADKAIATLGEIKYDTKGLRLLVNATLLSIAKAV